MGKKLPVYAEFSAGATRNQLKIFSNEKWSGFGIIPPLFAKRSKVGKFEGNKSTFVFVNEVCSPEEADVVILLKVGYRLEKGESIEPILWSESSATRESGVLMIVPINFEFEVRGYKDRSPSQYYRVTREGLIDITNQFTQEEQVPV